MKNEYGYEVGDYAIVTTDTHHYFKRGDVVKLREDDDSYNPWWDKVSEVYNSSDLNRVIDYGQVKPCNKYGWSVGDKGVAHTTTLTVNEGDVVTLHRDDGSQRPFWTGATAGFTIASVGYNRITKLNHTIEKVAEKVVDKPTTLKLAVKGYKFKVSSPKQSKRLQKVLFKLGYTWGYNSTEVLTMEHTELYANTQAKRLTQTSSRTYFDQHEYQEVNIKWLVKLK